MRSDLPFPSSRCAQRSKRRMLYVLLLFAMAFGVSAAADESISIPGGDAERGRTLFFSCKACHELAPADIRTTDDSKLNLFGLFGRRVGFDPNYNHYSAALKDADFIWTEDRLDQWLKSPILYCRAIKCHFQGL